MYCINCGNEENDNEAISDGYEGSCKYCEGFPGGYEYTIYENKVKKVVPRVILYRVKDELTGLYSSGCYWKDFNEVGRVYNKISEAKGTITRYNNLNDNYPKRKLVIEEAELVPIKILEK